jgi:predicted dehydrogenase
MEKLDRVRMGIIGCGRISDLNILGYLDHPKCELVAVCDISEDLARRRMKEWGAKKYYTDYNQLMADPEINAVEILLPHRLHLPAVEAAARAGKHISLQKPMCVDLWEGRRMVDLAKQAGVWLRVTENFFFYPPYRLQKKWLDAGEIGEPVSIDIRLCGAAGGWWVPIKTWLWRLDIDECGGTPTVYDDGYHKLSIAKHFMGEIEKVKVWIDFAFETMDTPSLVTWQYKSGALGLWEVTTALNMTANGKYYGADEWVEVTGTKGVLTATRCTSRLLEIPPLVLYKDGRHIAIDDIRDDWADSFHDAGWNFIDSLLEGRQPELTGEDGLYLMRFWKAIWKSHLEKREVYLDELKEDDKGESCA